MLSVKMGGLGGLCKLCYCVIYMICTLYSTSALLAVLHIEFFFFSTKLGWIMFYMLCWTFCTGFCLSMTFLPISIT